MAVTEWFYESRELASQGAASRIARALQTDLDAHNQASIVVSGGSSPKLCLNVLADFELPWKRVQVILSDERYLPANHPESNEGMIRQELFHGRAADATMLSMYQDGVSAPEQCQNLEKQLSGLPRPFSSALLGMGADGHFASLFPDFDRLAEGLDVNNPRSFLPVQTAASPFTRITMTLSALLDSNEILLLIFGGEKRAVYEQARQANSSYPVSGLMQQDQTPVHVFWAP